MPRVQRRAAASYTQEFFKNRGISPVLHDSPHSPPSATASHPRSVGNGHTQACGRFECSRPRTRLYPAVSMVPRNGRNACHILSLWCDVVRGRSTEREAASHHGAGSTHRVERIESTNQIGSHGRVHLSNRIFTAHTNLPVFYYFTVLMFIGFGQKKQTQQIVRSGSLSSSLPTRSMTAT